jgi:hypothetical protein
MFLIWKNWRWAMVSTRGLNGPFCPELFVCCNWARTTSTCWRGRATIVVEGAESALGIRREEAGAAGGASFRDPLRQE